MNEQLLSAKEITKEAIALLKEALPFIRSKANRESLEEIIRSLGTSEERVKEPATP